ncbi:MAG: hypothetical protein Q4G49_03445 [Paracoccus sp. (in: a-proteobacteria)]|nr:hypothetical protein [Paracoccus sp. (in: a-proteobacteria)]
MAIEPDRFMSNGEPLGPAGLFEFLRRYETHHKPQPRAVFWTFATGDKTNPFISHIWFENGSDDVLQRVSFGSFDFATVDEQIRHGTAKPLSYDNVMPKEAIKFDTRDALYDSDYIIDRDILIERAGQPPLMLLTKLAKGGTAEQVLL